MTSRGALLASSVEMFVNRLAIAGMSWVVRTALSLRGTGKPERSATPQRKSDRHGKPSERTVEHVAASVMSGRVTERSAMSVRTNERPAETQEVLAPDQDMIMSMNADDIGFEGVLR